MLQKLFSVCVGVSVLCSSVVVAAEGELRIERLEFDSLLGPGYFEIYGSQFGTNPQVLLDGSGLEVFTALPHKIVVANVDSTDTAELKVVIGEQEATYEYKTPDPKIYRIVSETTLVPGAEIMLHGEYFGSANESQVLLDDVVLRSEGIDDETISVSLPFDFSAGSLVVKNGKRVSEEVDIVPAHTMTFLNKGIRVFSQPEEIISVRLSGLGTDVEALDVYFDDELLEIISFAGDALEIKLPSEIRSGTLYVVRDNQKSNFLPIVYDKAPVITAIESLENKTITATHPQSTFVLRGYNFGQQKNLVSLEDEMYDFTNWTETSINVRARMNTGEVSDREDLFMTRIDGVESNRIPVRRTFEERDLPEASRLSFAFSEIDSPAQGEDVVLAAFSLQNQNQDLYIQRFAMDFVLEGLGDSVALHQFGNVRLRSSDNEYPVLLDGVGSTMSMKVLDSIFVAEDDVLEVVADVSVHLPKDVSYQVKANLASRQLFGFANYRFELYPHVDRDMIISDVITFVPGEDSFCKTFIDGDYDCNGINDEQEIFNEQEQELIAEVVTLQEEFVAAIEELEEETQEVVSEKEFEAEQELLGYGTKVMPSGHVRNLVLPRLAKSDLDSDGDGIVDVVELVIGTDPENEDTDGDTVLDADELQRGWDPKSTRSYVFKDQKALPWAEPYVMEMHFLGLITGDAMEHINPSGNITRAELLKILTQAFSFDHLDSESGVAFTDTEDHWVNQYALFAFENNLIRGYRDGSFWPDREVSRAEALKLLFKFMEIEIDMSAKTRFVDVSGWQVPYVALAEDLELISSSARFNPNNALKRGEAFKLIATALRQLN